MLKKINNILIEYNYKKISNKTIVFLHGFGGNLNNFSKFSEIFNNLGYSTLNINLTDFGFKTLPKFFNIYNFSETVFLLIKSLNIKKASVIGHSFGGRIAIILASMYKVVDKLILVDSAGLKPKFNLKTKLKILQYKTCKLLVKNKVLSEKCLLKFGSTDYKSLNNNLKSVFNNVVNEDLSFLLKKIKCKTLIYFGKKDKDTPVYMAKKLHKNILNSKLVLVDAGHYAYLEKSLHFTNLIKRFLNNECF